MRPAGEVRRALRTAAHTLIAEGQRVTWRDMGVRACVGLKTAQRTVENMARSGELEPAGSVHVPGSRRPMTVYRLPVPTAPPPAQLDQLMRCWR